MPTHTITRPPVKGLRCDALHVGSVSADWRAINAANPHPDGGGYTAYGAERCEDCGAVVVLTEGQGGETHRELDRTDCDGYISTFEGPMMSYSYALPGFSGEPLDDARQLVDLPLCLIEWGEASGREGWALALTGGGMDLSWQICEAFMLLGFLPPLKYAGGLPNIGERGARARYVLSGARRAVTVARAWLRSDAARIAQLAKVVRETDAARKAGR